MRWAAALMPFLAACTSRVSIPATELPALATSMKWSSEGSYDLRWTDGRTASLNGPVETIEIIYKSGAVVPLTPPFSAWVQEKRSELIITDALAPQEQVIPLALIERVDVRYEDSVKHDYAVGIPLVAGSIPLLICGTIAVIDAARPKPVSLMFNDLGYVVGGVLLVGGLTMALPGISIIGRDRSKTSTTERNDVTSKVSVRPVGLGSEPPPAARRFVTVGPMGVSGAF